MRKDQLVVRWKGELVPVQLRHWWPGRPGLWNAWQGVVFKLRGKTPKYATFMSVRYKTFPVKSQALCCPTDHPTRKAGRFIAMLRLARSLKRQGLRIERA